MLSSIPVLPDGDGGNTCIPSDRSGKSATITVSDVVYAPFPAQAAELTIT